MDVDKILLKTHLYHCMILVDKILGYSVTNGTGTSQDTIMVDVDKATAKIKQLQSELSWVYSHCELRDGDNIHINSDDVQSVVAAETAKKAENQQCN